MTDIKWIKDCEICNTGLCSQMQSYIDDGTSEREASRKMEGDCDGLWSAEQIRDRYRYYARGKKSTGGNPPKNMKDTLLAEKEVPHNQNPESISFEDVLRKAGLEAKPVEFPVGPWTEAMEQLRSLQHFMEQNCSASDDIDRTVASMILFDLKLLQETYYGTLWDAKHKGDRL